MESSRLAEALGRGNLVKICGLRKPEDAAAAAAAGADLLGFIFAPARRQVSADVAKACIAAAREAAGDREIVAIGVFVDAQTEEIEAIVRAAGLDGVQLHGSEAPLFLSELNVPAVKALRPRNGVLVGNILDEIDTFRRNPPSPAGFLIDGYGEGAAGGTGTRADWDLAAGLSATVPFVLAGGLHAGNVAEAIRRTKPLGVDVSSGVEVAGEKSATSISEFIRAARQAFQQEADPQERL